MLLYLANKSKLGNEITINENKTTCHSKDFSVTFRLPADKQAQPLVKKIN